MATTADYCAFTKAIEHLGDRWSLVIIRDLIQYGSRGFNALADGLPGVSRSVLAARLRKLERLDLIERDPTGRGGRPGYRLTPAGKGLEPALRGLWEWSLRWLPEDPSLVEHDPDIVTAWLSHQIAPERLPAHRVVLELDVRGTRALHFWLVLDRDTDPSVCIEDPCLARDRYVYLEADAAALFPLARGRRRWPDAVRDRSVRIYGEPDLVRSLPGWFREPIAAGA